ncbi:MAG: hypothetical protein CM15mP78_05590 [Candidatus Poseidoniales archaeon]|nr:MAG: hypothetical protein CM15mP78_05590 [Candidatus Poseidoniales archaeon]
MVRSCQQFDTELPAVPSTTASPPLLTALVARHLGIVLNDKQLTMELIEVNTVPDALAWGYAGAVPEPIPWVYTGSIFGKFRTKALLKKAVDAASEVDRVHPLLVGHDGIADSARSRSTKLPTRMFEQEIWLNLTAPLKHQLDSSAVVAMDDSMANKCVNALRWDGRGWWCAGVDGTGVADVLHHHGRTPPTMFSVLSVAAVPLGPPPRHGPNWAVGFTSFQAGVCSRTCLTWTP